MASKTITLYSEAISDKWFGQWKDNPVCYYCGLLCEKNSHLWTGNANAVDHIYGRSYRCPKCGWWRLEHHQRLGLMDPFSRTYYRGILKKFDIKSDRIPIELLRDYLNTRYDDIHLISPSQFEHIVRDVFSDFYQCEVKYFKGKTYSRDGGIDLIMLQTEKGPKAIQVKRRSYSEKGEPVNIIREFLGAIFLQNYKCGIFVTTGHFTKYSERTAITASEKGVKIELVDVRGFKEILNETCQATTFINAYLGAIRELYQKNSMLDL